MAKSKATELREKAEKLLKMAEAIERKKAERIGRLVLAHVENDFANFSIDVLKKEVSEME